MTFPIRLVKTKQNYPLKLSLHFLNFKLGLINFRLRTINHPGIDLKIHTKKSLQIHFVLLCIFFVGNKLFVYFISNVKLIISLKLIILNLKDDYSQFKICFHNLKLIILNLKWIISNLKLTIPNFK